MLKTSEINIIKQVKLAVNLVWQTHYILFIQLVILTIFTGIMPVILAFLGKIIVDGINSGKDLKELTVVVIILSAVGITDVVLIYTLKFSQEKIRELVSRHLNNKLVQHSAKLDLEFFENPESNDILSRAKQDISFRPIMLVQSIFSSAQVFVTMIGFIFILYRYPIILLGIAASMIPTIISSRGASIAIFGVYDFSTREGRKSFYLDQLITSSDTAKELRLLNTGKYFADKKLLFIDSIINKRIDVAKKNSLKLAGSDVFSKIIQYSLLFYIAKNALDDRFTVGDYVLLTGATIALNSQLISLISNIQGIYENGLFFSNLTKFFEYQPKIEGSSGDTTLNLPIKSGIKFKNVSFFYPGTNKKVLDNVSFELLVGQSTALVGVNGAGKTSIVKLLTRLYDPSEGSIELDGENIKNYDVDEYRSLFAVILQDFIKYNLTIEENIFLGDIHVPKSLQKIENSASLASISRFVESQPNRWETECGRQFDSSGVDLSGGQWQRLALARALYRNSPILVLDEPSASIDSIAEEEIFNKYESLITNRISLLISHRFSNIKTVDKIIVLEGGKIIEEGSHDFLIEMAGHYYKMFNAQAKNYTS